MTSGCSPLDAPDKEHTFLSDYNDPSCDSTGSLYGTSSDSLESWSPGIGALSGRAVQNLGEFLLGAAEKAVIRARIFLIGRKFPHSDFNAPPCVSGMYEHLLELSRVEYYNSSTRRRALRAILTQIGSRQTFYLTMSLRDAHWPYLERDLFFKELMACLPSQWFTSERRSALHMSLTSAYLKSQPQDTTHPAIPFIRFVCQLSQHDAMFGYAAISAGILDMFLRLCWYGLDPVYATRTRLGKSGLMSACDDALILFVQSPLLRALVYAHPICLLWPQSQTSIFFRASGPSVNDDYPIQTRARLWRRLEGPLVAWRLDSIEETLNQYAAVREHSVALVEACADLVELSREDKYEKAHVDRALSQLFIFIALGADSWDILRSIIGALDPDGATGVLNRLVFCVRDLTNHSLTYDPAFKGCRASPSKSDMSRGERLHLCDCFLGFVLGLGSFSPGMRQILRSTSIIAIILPILQCSSESDSEGPGLRALQRPHDRRPTNLPAEPADTQTRKDMCIRALEMLTT